MSQDAPTIWDVPTDLVPDSEEQMREFPHRFTSAWVHQTWHGF